MPTSTILKLIILTSMVVAVDGNRNHKCTSRCRKEFKLCASNKCCCSSINATCCNYGPDLTYIPHLPQYIQNLRFENNYLQVLSKDSFSNISTGNIRMLYLVNNSILNISDDAFSEFVKLESLYLDSNKLVKFSAKPFQNLKQLKYISLGSNKIRYISNNAIQESFEGMNLSNNALVGELLEEWFCSADGTPIFPKLKKLQFIGNFISKLTNDSLKCLKQLQQLGFNENVIMNVQENVFANLHNLKKVQFAYMHRSIKQIADNAFNNSHMAFLNFRENYIIIRPELSEKLFQHSTNIRNLDISLNNMKKLSPDQFLTMLKPLKRLQKLTACRCQIIRLSKDFLSFFRDLKKLNLDGNSIHTLDSFRNVFSLNRLSLQGNSFSVINEYDVSDDFMNSIEIVNFCDNPFDCTCALLWFRSMIDDDTKRFGNISLTNWPRRYECLTPTKLLHKKLIDYRPTKASCTSSHVLEIAIICLSTVLVMASAVSIVSYRYRWHIKYWFYKINAHSKDPETRPLLDYESPGFDGYVIYNTDDRQFVHHDLRLFMEEKHGYNLHIWERNAPGSGAKLEAMVDGIHASEHAIAVISNNSIQDRWVEFQMDVALDRQVELKKGFLILVILENVDFTTLSRYWCVMLTRLHAARWCQDNKDVKRAVFEQQMTSHFGKPKDKSVQ